MVRFECVSSATRMSWRVICFLVRRTVTVRGGGMERRVTRRFGVGVCGWMDWRCVGEGRAESAVIVTFVGMWLLLLVGPEERKSWRSWRARTLLLSVVVLPKELVARDPALLVKETSSWDVCGAIWDESSVSWKAMECSRNLVLLMVSMLSEVASQTVEVRSESDSKDTPLRLYGSSNDMDWMPDELNSAKGGDSPVRRCVWGSRGTERHFGTGLIGDDSSEIV